MFKSIIIILVILITGVSGPPLIKYGAMHEESRIASLLKGDVMSVLYILLNPYILTGLTMYFISAILWIIILAKYELSFVSPLLSINYVFALFVGYYFFNENLNLYKWLGVILITAGVILITFKKINVN
ncbi:EamA family transporter [Fodinisporobacter ferrooxydans]|uniref:EamA family transporter n=1 Tax=Fodinisporobacter ferrooxydans TaxID=2901836 RepID=A0ABY4CN91_9BACL|nr:EamA family transporter [Alicyclobacillaceae bacterium MYW30-H2]